MLFRVASQVPRRGPTPVSSIPFTITSRSFHLSRSRAGNTPPLPPFVRTRNPKGKLNNDHELIWDDRVAAETCLDLDALHISTGEAVKMWAGALLTLTGLYQLCKFINPSSYKVAVPVGETLPPVGLDFIDKKGEGSETEEEE